MAKCRSVARWNALFLMLVLSIGCSDDDPVGENPDPIGEEGGSDEEPGDGDPGDGDPGDEEPGDGEPGDEDPGDGSVSTDCETAASDGFVRPFPVDEALYPFDSCAFATPSGRMHYIDEGPKDAETTIVMVHGNPTWSFLYRNIVQAALGAGHRVVVPDHLGMGMSDVPSVADFDYRPRSHSANLEDLVVALDLNNITLVVQDWGGPIGLGMATRQPDRIDRMLIMNTWAWSIDEENPGDFHALVGWSNRAKSSAEMNPNFFCEFALPTSSTAIAAEVDPTEGELFEQVLNAYLAPGVDPDTGEPLYDEPCAPMQIFAESITDDDAFQGEVEVGLSNLQGKPYSLYYGLRDRNFGVLRCDAMRDNACPGTSACVCDASFLAGDATCETPGAEQFFLCKEADGSFLEPSADRFEDLLGSETLIRRESNLEAEHMIQEWDPEGVSRFLGELLAAP